MTDSEKPDPPRPAGLASAEPAAEPRRRALSLPEGSIGLFLLIVFAALFGGLTATYWPLVMGGETTITEDRIAALETRVGEIATGRSGAAASGAFADLRRNLGALTERLTAGEARLTALEKTQAAGVPGAPAPADTAPLRADADASAAQIAQLTQRLARLEGTSATAEQVRAFNDTMARLQARVAALDADIARSSETHRGALDSVNLRIAKIEASIPANLAERLDALAPRTDLTAAEARIAQLETLNAGETLHRAAAILALANLSNAAAQGRPFTVELEAFAAAQPHDAAAAALRPFARTGVPTANLLRARFPLAARAALDVSRTALAGDVMSRLWANIQSLISIRRVGEVDGADTESRLARAQVRVDAGDLAGAVTEASAVQGPGSAALRPWLNDARNRVALDRTLAQMNARVVRSLAAAARDTDAAPVRVEPPPARPPLPVPAPTEGRSSPTQ
jgi:hypothetical protein